MGMIWRKSSIPTALIFAVKGAFILAACPFLVVMAFSYHMAIEFRQSQGFSVDLYSATEAAVASGEMSMREVYELGLTMFDCLIELSEISLAVALTGGILLFLLHYSGGWQWLVQGVRGVRQ